MTGGIGMIWAQAIVWGIMGVFLAVINYFFAKKLERNRFVWVVFSIIPFVNYVFSIYVFMTILFFFIDGIREIKSALNIPRQPTSAPS